MKRIGRFDAGVSSDASGLFGSEVVFAPRQLPIRTEENRLNEQHLGARDKIHDSWQVVLGPTHISDITQVLPSPEVEHLSRASRRLSKR